MLAPVDLRVAGRHGHVVDAEPGRPLALTWRLVESMQSHYQVVVSRTVATSGESGPSVAATAVGPTGVDSSDSIVWDGGRIPGSRSRASVPGEHLPALTRLTVRVRTWARDDGPSAWSEPLTLTTGPGPSWPDTAAIWAPGEPDWAMLRGDVELDPAQRLVRAALYASAVDPEPARQYVYRLWLNGRAVGLGPVRSIASEHRFDGFDVTELLRRGRNRLVALCYTTAGHAFQALLVVWLRDGRVLRLGTGGAWQALADPRRRRLGELGTSHFSAPQEDVGPDTDPQHLSDLFADHDPDGWVGVVARPTLADLRPAPMDKVETALVAPAVVEERPARAGREYRLDFGRTIVGGLVAPPGASSPVTVRSAELRDATGRARYELSTTNVYRDRFTPAASTSGTPLWGMRVFRYADVDGLPPGLTAADLRAEEQVYPFEPVSVLTTSDVVLQQVWDFCAQTVRATNHHLFVDSWTREREPYEADAYAQLRANLALVGEQGVARYSLQYLMRRRTWPTEWPLFMIFAVHDHVLHTGDLDLAAEQLEALIALAPERWIDSATGLITKREGSDGSSSSFDHDIVDWPPAERDGYVFAPVNTVINAFAHRVFTDLAALCRWLGDDRAARFAERADAVRDVINARLFDPEAGTYRDGLDGLGRPIGHHAVHAAAFCAAFGVVPEERSDQVGSWLASRGMACSVYAAPYLIEGLAVLGRSQDAYRLLTSTGPRSWAHMIRLGAGATGEAWSEADKPNLSWSHPWGASPSYLIAELLLGVRPLQPGFGRFAVRPSADGPDVLAATLQTAVGPIGVRLRRNTEGRDLELAVPGNATALVELDARPPLELGPGRWRVTGARHGEAWGSPEPMRQSHP